MALWSAVSITLTKQFTILKFTIRKAQLQLLAWNRMIQT